MTNKLRLLCIGILAIMVGGCADQQSLTREEMENQNRIDAIVSGALFENELDEMASYNIHKNGFVVIKFDESVPSAKYNHIVEMLRSNEAIKGLRAEQSGVEVCPMSSFR